MRHPFLLRAGAALVISWIALAAGACGGKVVFDSGATGNGGFGGVGGNSGHGGFGGFGGNGGGFGGFGGSTGDIVETTTGFPFTTATSGFPFTTAVGPGPTTTTAVGPGPTTATGPSCDCDQFCSIAKQCGVNLPQCTQLCTQIPPELVQCACQSGGNCGSVQMCIGASAVGSSAVSTGTGAGSQCSQCVNDAAPKCSSEFAACAKDPNCVQLLGCVQSCGTSSGCKNKCESAFPKAKKEATSVVDCAVCKTCGTQCISEPLATLYCGPVPL